MKTTTCRTATRFRERIERLRAKGLEVTIETEPATICFGRRTSASIYLDGTFASWTLYEAGGICKKRTSVRTYAARDCKRTDIATAMRYINSALDSMASRATRHA